MLIAIIIGIVILLIIATQTLWLHQKPKRDILTTDFSSHQDLWFKKENNNKLLIMLHGMYSNPDFFREAATHIIEQGWDVYVPVLPNASTSAEDLASQESYQWKDSLKVALQKSLIYNKDYQKIALGGHSQGGTLAMSIAPSLPFLSGLIIVASPVNLIHKKNSFIRNLGISLSGLVLLLLPKKGLFLKNKNAEEKSKVEGRYSEREFYFALTLHSMNLGVRKTKKNLSQITSPCFLAYEKGDKVASFSDFLFIKNKIPSVIKEVIFNTPLSEEPYSKRHKLFGYIYTKDRLIQEISSFLQPL